MKRMSGFLRGVGFSVLLVIPAGTYGEEAIVIADNSFFIEEAYNQEAGVVQHIFNSLYYGFPTRDFASTFTQEWPLGDQTHQLSCTVPISSLNGGAASGIGDVLLNYRYQWMFEEEGTSVSPRLSALLPTGDSTVGLGSASWGIQVNLPVSVKFSPRWVAHLNLGSTWSPAGRGFDASGNEVRASLVSFNAGASLIWLQGSYNFLVETVLNNVAQIDSTGVVQRATEYIVSPGVRFAFQVGAVQIVPGFAVPFSWTATSSRTGVLVYLSFEHPF